MLGIAVALSGCGVTSQLHSELSYNGTGANVLLAADGIGVLTPAAPTGQESDKQALGDAVGSALQNGSPGIRVISLSDTLSAINRAGLARDYSSMLNEYELTGILERDGLRRIGQASGVRYFAKLNLGNFTQSSDKRLSIAGIRMFDTWRANIRVHLEIWDSMTGEIAWQGNEELVFAREGVKERPVSFRQVADLASANLVKKIGATGTDTLDQEAESVADATVVE
jgi:hypothetical protein